MVVLVLFLTFCKACLIGQMACWMLDYDRQGVGGFICLWMAKGVIRMKKILGMLCLFGLISCGGSQTTESLLASDPNSTSSSTTADLVANSKRFAECFEAIGGPAVNPAEDNGEVQSSCSQADLIAANTYLDCAADGCESANGDQTKALEAVSKCTPPTLSEECRNATGAGE
jgi:hypothetical protein